MINKDSIVQYIDQLAPKSPKEIAQTTSDVKAIMASLTDFVQRLNTTRKVALLQEQLAETKTEIEGLTLATQQLSSMNEEYQQLLQLQESLLTEQANINDLTRQKTEIQNLQSHVAKYDTSGLGQELQQIKEGAAPDVIKINAWLHEAIAFLPQLQGSFVQETWNLLSKVNVIRKDITAVLDETKTVMGEECTTLSGLLQDYDATFTYINTQYNALVQQLTTMKTRLQDVKNKHDKNVALYQLHFAQDKHIYGEMGKHHRLDPYLEQLAAAVDEKLCQFDKEIKNQVEKIDLLTIF